MGCTGGRWAYGHVHTDRTEQDSDKYAISNVRRDLLGMMTLGYDDALIEALKKIRSKPNLKTREVR